VIDQIFFIIFFHRAIKVRQILPRTAKDWIEMLESGARRMLAAKLFAAFHVKHSNSRGRIAQKGIPTTVKRRKVLDLPPSISGM